MYYLLVRYVGFARRRHRSLWALVPSTGNMTISKKCQKNSPNVLFTAIAMVEVQRLGHFVNG
ncbi:hypothetical protein [Nostoc sp. 'Peltigera membranacea cyanobiont' 210A]|uniref:hypothetical protein n=1 Tax=Nostoc sp. 'Peltigera membranacea cyanobiont' 210A TaxID=2014529 RepID=UPI001180E6C7|nr:hypothetical protein [Nostoc sp. 'Peltigera membranacea cyanobiont' 210A]